MKLNINELSDQYNLRKSVVISEIEIAISNFLKLELGEDIECIYDQNKDEFKIYAYKGDMSNLVEISPKKIHIKNLNEMLYVVQARLISQTLEKDFQYYERKVHSLILGKVVKILDNQMLIVEYDDKETGETIYGECPVFFQPEREVGRYVIGYEYLFYISKVLVTTKYGMPKLLMELNRKTKTIVDILLKQELAKHNIFDIKITSIKRIAGAYTGLFADKSIPREVIKTVADYLEERIIVKYVSEIPDDPIIYDNSFWKDNKVKIKNGQIINKNISENTQKVV